MKEELITFETAKIAKELGFNLKCDTFYGIYKTGVSKVISDNNFSDKYQLLRKRDYGIYAIQIKDWNSGGIYDDYDVSCPTKYSAPTQSLLAKWIREEHNLHIHFNTTTDNKWYCTLVKVNNGIGFMGGGCLKNKIEHDNYEQALEEALFEALKLVKNERV